MNEEELIKVVSKVTSESKELLDNLAFKQIATEVDFVRAGRDVATWKSALKKIESQRKDLTDPLNATVKKINAQVKPATTFFETAIKIITEKMSAYQIRLEQEQAKVIEEIETSDVEVDKDIPVVPKVSGMTSHDTWDFEIVDVSQLPREFMTPDPVAIRAFVKKACREDAIPGVRAFVKKVFVNR